MGGCIIGSANAGPSDNPKYPGRYAILLVLALGKPVEQVTITATDSIKYWGDENRASRAQTAFRGAIPLFVED